LQRNLPAVRVSATAPTSPSGSIVHIQHEPSIMDDESLERYIVQARAAGTAVAITEHAVLTRPAAWEGHARALVAATSAGAARLRARHPSIPVVHIPLGCETWSFPRKTRRGRTIGFFGFPGEHKGHSRMSAALRLIPGCEVLMFGYGSSRESVRDWPSDVPVRCEPDWLPLPEVAAQLAASADVLVFHYDEFIHNSASSAVLVGLSTGVPVLTSATNWFDDHGDSVYRAGRDAAGLATGLERLLDDDELRERTVSAAREYCVSNSWTRTAARHVELWNSFETS
jgi:glycosyltransferase involved in cell wall biosynthesis